MKNSISLLVVLVLSMTLVNCTQETIPLNESSAPVNTDYSGSKVKINDQKFIPTAISVLEQPTKLITRKKKTFILSKEQGDAISIQFNYATGDTINGTYPTKTNVTNHALLTFYRKGFAFSPISGEVKITEFANSIFRIEFLDVIVENPNYKEPSTIPVVDPTDETTTETTPTTETTEETTNTKGLKVNYVVAEENPTPVIDPVLQAIYDDPTKHIITGAFQATFIIKSRVNVAPN